MEKGHNRKLWNVLLLFSFLATGLIGLLMVIKINYKLQIPYYEALLSYHVYFGIGMFLVGIIHFWWHLNYYLNLFKGEKPKEADPPGSVQNDLNSSDLRKSAFLLGSTSMIAQIILVREFLSVFKGNELVIGLVLANWMVLTGIGASLGKHSIRTKKVSGIVFPALLILSVLPFITAFMINYLKNKIFPVGAMIDLFQIFTASLLLLIPFCLVSGFLFTYISGHYSEVLKKNETGTVYGIESVGSIIGGLLSALIFIFVFSSIESLLVLAAINGAAIFLIGKEKGVSGLSAASLIIVFSAVILLFLHPEKGIRKWVYPNQRIEVSKDSPYGNIVVTTRGDLRSVYTNNILMYDSENFMLNEESVHFVMGQRPSSSNILLVSGDLCGQIRELKKYNPISIDCVEENRWLLVLSTDSLSKILSEVITVQSCDPIRFIRNSLKYYDIALLNLPSPSTLQNNRFYTLEFFRHMKEKLTPGAVLSFGLPAPVNYLNQEALDLTSTLLMTLKRAFKNVIIIPGEKNYFLASDNPLNYGITAAIQQRGIENRYVNSDYFNDNLIKNRGEAILSSLNPDIEINQNLKPVLYKQEMDFWLTHFNGKYWLAIFLVGLLSLYVFMSGNISAKAIFLTGFSATGLEVILLFGLVSYFGAVYLLTNLVFTGFMAGLAIGSLGGKLFTQLTAGRYLSLNQLLIGIFSAATACLLYIPGIMNISQVLVYCVFMAAVVLTGVMTGFQFTKASHNQTGSFSIIPGRTYSYDLYGSALGALLLSLFAIPKLGIVTTAIILCILNLLFGIFLTLKGINKSGSI